MIHQQWSGRSGRRRPPRFPRWWILLVAVSAVLIVVGLVQILDRAAQDNAARRATDALRNLKGGAEVFPTATLFRPESAAPSPSPAQAPQVSQETVSSEAVSAGEVQMTAEIAPVTEAPPAESPEFAVPQPTPEITQEQASGAASVQMSSLRDVPYPENPDRKKDAWIRSLQQENRDIIGWLNAAGIVDEPVVQRDNVFYMDHDVRKESNINGTLFMDEMISLETRPYGMILYGHNMRSGGMFGSLRNYDKPSFYRSTPILTFNTEYEKGRYAIFASGIVNVEETAKPNYLDLYALTSRSVPKRDQAIQVLKSITPYDGGIDVRPEDQLLILVTCDGQEKERRVVAARRVRDGEDEESLRKQVQAAIRP